MKIPKTMLFISAHKNQHRRELLNVACYPKGALVKVVYSLKWIPYRLQHAENYKGEDALVVFCEFTSYNGENTKFHPVRLVKIRDCSKNDGGLTYILEMGEYVDYYAESTENEAALKNFNELALTYVKDLQVVTCRWFVAQINEDFEINTTTNWINLTQHLRNLETINKCSFFKIDDADFSKSLFSSFLDKKYSFFEKKFEFSIKSGEAQIIKIKSIAGKELKDKTPIPKIELSNTVGQALGPLISQFSEGIQTTYQINIFRQLEHKQTLLRVFTPDVGEFNSPVLEGFLKIKINYFMFVIAVILIATAPVFAMQNSNIWGTDIPVKFVSYFLSVIGNIIIYTRIKSI